MRLIFDAAAGGRFLLIELELSLLEKASGRFWLDFHDGNAAIGWVSVADVLDKAEPGATFVRALCSFSVPVEVRSTTIRFVTETAPPVHLFGLDFGADFECAALDRRCTIVNGERERPGPVTLVGGMAKSGTTWISSALNRHPGVVMLNEAELFCALEPVKLAMTMSADVPDYVSLKRHAPDVFDRAMIANVREGLHLISLIAAISGVSTVGDKSPAYAFYYEKLLNLITGVRVVHCERNPADTFVSRIYHDAAIYREHSGLLHESIPVEVHELFESGDLAIEGEIDLAKWGAALEVLIKIFAQDYSFVRREAEIAKRTFPTKFYVVVYENLLNNPIYELDKLFSFLGCPLGKREVERIAHLSSFKAMSGGRDNGQADNASFFRKGVSGDARRLLGREGLTFFEKVLASCSFESAAANSFIADLVHLNHIK